MDGHRIVTRKAWLAERIALLAQEKALTRARDALARQRRALPWVRVEKNYIFEGPQGPLTLAELFDGRSQLIVKHFMFGPGWKEGCVGCSFECDHFDGARMHLERHDVTLVAVSRAPLAEILAFRERMGWRFPWVSSAGTDFNQDFHVSFTPEAIARGEVYYNYSVRPFEIEELSGLSVFCRDEAGAVYHTYSAYARGAEEVIGAYMLLDLTPKGRNETGPNRNLTDWVRHHDRYGDAGRVDATGRYRSEPGPCCGH